MSNYNCVIGTSVEGNLWCNVNVMLKKTSFSSLLNTSLGSE